MDIQYLSVQDGKPVREGICVMPDHWVHGFSVVTNHNEPVDIKAVVDRIQDRHEVVAAVETHASAVPNIQTFHIRIRTMDSGEQGKRKIQDAFSPAFAVVARESVVCFCK